MENVFTFLHISKPKNLCIFDKISFLIKFIFDKTIKRCYNYANEAASIR